MTWRDRRAPASATMRPCPDTALEEASAPSAFILGGPVIIPEDLRAAALQRAMAFAAAGTRSAQ